MRNCRFTHLWTVWGIWGLVLIAYLSPYLPSKAWGILATIWIVICVVVAIYTRNKTTTITMFKSKKKSEALPQEPVTVSSNLPADNMALGLTKDESTAKQTLIAKGTKLTGEVINESDVMIEGMVIGDIKSTGTIRIGKEGEVQGTVTAEKIMVNGLIKGRCQARSVKILSHGRLDGDIQASELSIERGGIFNGNSQHAEDKSIPLMTDKLSVTTSGSRQSQRELSTTSVKNTSSSMN